MLPRKYGGPQRCFCVVVSGSLGVILVLYWMFGGSVLVLSGDPRRSLRLMVIWLFPVATLTILIIWLFFCAMLHSSQWDSCHKSSEVCYYCAIRCYVHDACLKVFLKIVKVYGQQVLKLSFNYFLWKLTPYLIFIFICWWTILILSAYFFPSIFSVYSP